MRRRPAWLGGPGKDADGAVLLTGPEAGELLKAAVGHAGGGLVDWHLDHVDANPGQSTTATYQARVQWPAGERQELFGMSARASGVILTTLISRDFLARRTPNKWQPSSLTLTWLAPG